MTTTTPGCAAFVRPGVEGLLVPPGDASALAQAFVDLASAPHTLADMGTAARARVLQGYTIDAVSAAIIALYRGLLGRG